MQAHDIGLDGAVRFEPTPFRDERGFFSRTFDAAAAAPYGIDPADLVQDSQSRTARGMLRGLHGRRGGGESKLMRCARGAVHLVMVDARPESAGFGKHVTLTVDDVAMNTVYVPRGMLVGFQALTEWADVCYKIDRAHDEREAVSVRYDDPTLGVTWPLPVAGMSHKDQQAPSWEHLVALLR